MPSVKDKYLLRLSQELGGQVNDEQKTSNYLEFKKNFLPRHLTIYEKLCNISEQVLHIGPDKKKAEQLKQDIEVSHLEISPAGATSFAYLFPLVVFVLGSLLSFLAFQSMFFVAYFLIIALVLVLVLLRLPEFLASNWRLKASNQMVQCVFYLVTYMRHTSNLERAVDFAAEHLSPPLTIDLKKILWDVETEKYGTIKEALDNYLERWRTSNLEFVEAVHLLEGSLAEGSEQRRLSLIDKSLAVMLDETYEKMQHYSHNLKGPLTILYMLGIILPVLGLVILPLVASFMASDINPNMLAIYIATLYNVTLPIGLFYLGKMILSKRPTGYGDTQIDEGNPQLKRPGHAVLVAGIVSFGLLLIGLMPVWLHVINPDFDMDIGPFSLLEYMRSDKGEMGPYGLGATILSLAVILAAGLGLGMYYRLRSTNTIKLRQQAKQLEDEFSSALFQLGNRLGDGVPAEVAFAKTSEMLKNTTSGDFFKLVTLNITRLGADINRAIFDKKIGALTFFPSALIESTMKVLVESIKKGPLIASQAMINVSQYIRDIHRVNERLTDLMADIVSDMKQQASLLAPAISAIVVGITSMIIAILNQLSAQLSQIESGTSDIGQVTAGQGLLEIFGQGMPTYYFQIIVGLYVVEVVFILTMLVSGIENGEDRVTEEYNLGQNLVKSTLLYVMLSFVVIMLFNILASAILSNVLQA
ncbi:hypothetical protein J4475_02510 [Candidatus Woesearchaeota archaeon]|nr:hypothetical protein [Candidatus Woesearchaeota archaeon]